MSFWGHLFSGVVAGAITAGCSIFVVSHTVDKEFSAWEKQQERILSEAERVRKLDRLDVVQEYFQLYVDALHSQNVTSVRYHTIRSFIYFPGRPPAVQNRLFSNHENELIGLKQKRDALGIQFTEVGAKLSRDLRSIGNLHGASCSSAKNNLVDAINDEIVQFNEIQARVMKIAEIREFKISAVSEFHSIVYDSEFYDELIDRSELMDELSTMVETCHLELK